jgi:phosphoglycolate phosphatase-like HAD superfamily hydrolase
VNVAVSDIEIIRSDFARGPFGAVLFDFDGTLSLIRRGWQDVMIPMMVEHLAATHSGESAAELAAVVEDFVARLTGRQTIYQMIELAAQVRARGGTPREPLAYKREYHDRLWKLVGDRVAALERGEAAADDWLVPGSRELLARLAAGGLPLYLASGTDADYVRREAAVLAIDQFFGPRIYGALDDYRQFSKAIVIQRILAERCLEGRQLVGLGDGYVEIQELRRSGGLAIGVASNEHSCTGINAWKRQRLIDAGADVIVGDYRPLDGLMKLIGVE